MGKINQNLGIRVVPWARSSNNLFNILNSVTPAFEPHRLPPAKGFNPCIPPPNILFSQNFTPRWTPHSVLIDCNGYQAKSAWTPVQE